MEVSSVENMPKISESEWEIMKVIWRENPITAEQIMSLLPKEYGWSDQTIRTFINRLLKKKVIGFEKTGRSYNYYPLLSEEECVWAESQSFIKRVFGGVSNMLVANFIEEVDLSQNEIEKLQKILEEKHKKIDGKD